MGPTLGAPDHEWSSHDAGPDNCDPDNQGRTVLPNCCHASHYIADAA